MSGRETPRRLRALLLTTIVTLSVFAVLVGGVGGAAGNTTSISSCTTIDEPGTHELIGEISATSETSCIAINASDVTIEGNGYTIDGFDDNTFDADGDPENINGSTAIRVTGTQSDFVENVTVRNVTLEDGNVGFNASYATDVTLEDVYVNGTDSTAVVTHQTNGSVALRDVTVERSAKFTTFAWRDPPEIAAIYLGDSTTLPEDLLIRPDRVTITNLSVEDVGDGDVASSSGFVALRVDSDGPVTVNESTVTTSTGSGLSIGTTEIGSDITVSNVTVDEYGFQSDTSGGGTGIWVDARGSADVLDSRVSNGAGIADGVDIGGSGLELANSTVENVSGVGAEVGANHNLVRNVRINDTLDAGLYVTDNHSIRNVSISNISRSGGWAVKLEAAGDDPSIRNVRVTDSGGGGLLVERASDADVRGVTISNVTDTAPAGGDDGRGLAVDGSAEDGTFRDIHITNTSGDGLSVRKTGDSSSFETLSFENLTVANPGGHGLAVDGDSISIANVSATDSNGHGLDIVSNSISIADIRIEDAGGVGIRKIPSRDDESFVAQNISIDGTGSDGFLVFPDFGVRVTPNNAVTLTDADVRNSTERGIVLYEVTSADLQNVSVADNSGVDLNVTNSSATFDRVNLSSTRIDGGAQNVTIEPIPVGQVPALPGGNSHVETFLEVNDTSSGPFLNSTIHYPDSSVPSDLDESTLDVWRYDGSTWSSLGGANDPAANIVSKNVTSFSVFALLGHDGSAPSPANYSVTVDATNSPVTEGESLSVDATVENTGDVGVTQTVTLSVDGTQQNSTEVTLADGQSQTVILSWATSEGDVGNYTATVSTDNDTATAPVTIEEPGGSDDEDDASNDGDDTSDDDSFTGGLGGSSGTSAGLSGPSDDGPPEAVQELVDAVTDDPGVQVPFDDGDVPVEELAFEDESLEGSGEVRVEALADPPAGVADEFGSENVVTAVDIEVPDEAENASATIRIRLSDSELGDRDLDSLQVVRVADGENQRLPTEVTERSDGGVTVEADTPGFSSFAVVSVEADAGSAGDGTTTTATETPTRTPEATPMDEDPAVTSTRTTTRTETPGGLDGFGPVVAVLAIVAAGLYAVRRRH